MYLAVYDADRRHVCNLVGADCDLTARVYDMDSFSARCVEDPSCTGACLLLLNDETGKRKYACFAESVRREDGEYAVKGMDLRTLWDTDILLDFTGENAFDGRLSGVFSAVAAALTEGKDAMTRRIPVRVEIGQDDTDTTAVYGSLAGTRRVVNAYNFLSRYLKYYDYYLSADYDPVSRSLVYRFVRETARAVLDLSDVLATQTEAEGTVNKTVALSKNGTDRVCFYRTRDNAIVEGDEAGNHTDGSPIEGRVYPVRTAYFEGETVEEARFDAVYELAGARYAACVTIDHHSAISPFDLSAIPLGARLTLWQNGREWGTLPLSERRTVYGEDGETVTVKLGYRKTLLTEIIKH